MKKVLSALAIVIALGVFVFSGCKIYEILSSRYMAKEHYKSYDEFVVVSTEETKATEATEKKKKSNVKCDIKIDFDSLKKKYPNAVGWIYMKDTVINYPVMQTTDNSYYLTRLPDTTINASGSIYADYRNTEPMAEDNYIIYGHNMKNGSMFGVLNKFRYSDFYNSHSYFYYLTPDKTYKVNILAGCDMNVNGEIYATGFSADKKNELVNELIGKSAFTPKKKYKKTDKLITLSTCSNSANNVRFVVVGAIQE